jgi:hypothetical protein
MVVKMSILAKGSKSVKAAKMLFQVSLSSWDEVLSSENLHLPCFGAKIVRSSSLITANQTPAQEID